MLHPGEENPGAPLLLESPHPYRDNTNIRQLVAVPGAVSLSISFDKQSSLEMTHDFIRFFKVDNIAPPTYVYQPQPILYIYRDDPRLHPILQGRV